MSILSARKRGALVGVLILTAYAMLAYWITGNRWLGAAADWVAGASVMAIALVLRPVFASCTPGLRRAWLAARLTEGALMGLAGVLLLIPAGVAWHDPVYQYVQVWFFILGAWFFYRLLLASGAVPRLIALWGAWATLALAGVTIAGLAGDEAPVLGLLVVPMIANELFLALWLMARGIAPPDPTSQPRAPASRVH